MVKITVTRRSFFVQQKSAKDRLSLIEQAVSRDDFEEAVTLAERLVSAEPRSAQAWNALGLALRASGRAQSAIACYRRALDLEKDRNISIFGNFANALKDLGRLEEAIALHTEVVARGPSPQAWGNLGVALRHAARYHEALAAYDQAVQLAPHNPDLQCDRAQVLLALGDYARGWPSFEWRMQSRELRDLMQQPFPRPFWDGRPLPGATLIVWPEQGYGDFIFSARFLPIVRNLVGRIVLLIKPELERLFQGFPGVDELVRVGTTVPKHAAHAPIMSLARHVMTTADQIPPPAVFRVPIAATMKVAPILARAGDRFKVGIVWSGSITFKGNAERSVTLERFLTFAELPGIQLFSLQKGAPASELGAAHAGKFVIDLAPHLSDFADTAAAIQGLDLIIMTDSSVAHLAASLGKPVWNLLPYHAYWLYLERRADSPWYPSMRLFRQQAPADWGGVFSVAKQELARTIEESVFLRRHQ